MSNVLVTPEALAKQLGPNITRRKVIDWARRYDWPRVQIGRMVAFRPEHVDQILATHTVANAGSSSVPRIGGQTKRSQRAAS